MASPSRAKTSPSTVPSLAHSLHADATPRVLPAARPTHTLAGWFALAYALGLIYGTLYPWSGWRGIGLSGFDYLTQPWPRYWTVFDLLTNVGLYAPFGALLGWFARHRVGALASILLSLVVGAALSATLEALQTFLPGRIPSNVDLLCNSIGTLAGALFALALWPTRLREQPLRLRHHAKVSIALLMIWFVVQALPQRLPFETGVMLGPLQDWLTRLRSPVDAPEDAMAVVLATELLRWLAPVQSAIGQLKDHRDLIEAGAVATWLASVGLLLCNVLTRSTWRPLAISVMLLGGLLLHLAAGHWLLSNSIWRYWVSPGSQGGAALGVLLLSLLSLLRRRHRLVALVVLLMTALVLTNLLPAGGYDELSGTVSPSWRHLFAVLDALALLWPVAAMIAAVVEWRSLAAPQTVRASGPPL